MSPKKGDRAARPPEPGRYTLKFATNDAAKGWEDLCRQAPSNTRTAYDAIEVTRARHRRRAVTTDSKETWRPKPTQAR